MKLQHSSVPQKREIVSGLKRLIRALAFSYIPSNSNRNIFWDAMEYPGPPNMKKQGCDLDPTCLIQNHREGCDDAGLRRCDCGFGRSGGGVAAAVLSKKRIQCCGTGKGPLYPIYKYI